MIQTSLTAKAHRFFIKDLGDLHYFLSIKVISTKSGLLQTQHKYIHDLLAKTNMTGVKACTTPMSFIQFLQLTDGSLTTDGTQFRKVNGALQYLSLTRPNVSFAVNKLARFMHAPTVFHWSTTKRVLRYLMDTMYHGLFLKCHQHLHLTIFTDADWVGNQDDYTSTLLILFIQVGMPFLSVQRSKKCLLDPPLKPNIYLLPHVPLKFFGSQTCPMSCMLSVPLFHKFSMITLVPHIYQ